MQKELEKEVISVFRLGSVDGRQIPKNTCPKNPDPSKVAILRTQTPAIQVQTPPFEGPKDSQGDIQDTTKLHFLTILEGFWK